MRSAFEGIWKLWVYWECNFRCQATPVFLDRARKVVPAAEPSFLGQAFERTHIAFFAGTRELLGRLL